MQLSDREWLARADVAQQGAMLKLLTQGAAERITAGEEREGASELLQDLRWGSLEVSAVGRLCDRLTEHATGSASPLPQ